MDRISFEIFIPEEKRFRVTPNLIVFSLWFSSIGILWAFEDAPITKEIKGYVALGIVLISLYYLIASFFTYEPLRGTLNGEIVFGNNAITMDSEIYELKDIKNIDFRFVNYYGQMPIRSGANFNPLLSQGVRNFITFTYRNDQSVKVYFKLYGKYGSEALYPFINTAVKCGAMTYYRAIDLIDVENVQKP